MKSILQRVSQSFKKALEGFFGKTQSIIREEGRFYLQGGSNIFHRFRLRLVHFIPLSFFTSVGSVISGNQAGKKVYVD